MDAKIGGIMRYSSFFIGVSYLALASGAWAQSAAPLAVEEVVVTGSRIVRNGNDAPTPVTVASGEQLNMAVPRSLTDALNQLPQFSSNQVSRGGNLGSANIT